MDYPRAWSRSGETIAFYRWYASSIGARGLYLIDPNGRGLRYVGDAFKDVSFSPDERRIAWIGGGLVHVHALATGGDVVLHVSPWSADWSPVSDSLAVIRLNDGSPSDSSGLWIISASSGLGRPLLVGGRQVHGSDVRWEPDGSHVVLLEAVFDNGSSATAWDLAEYDVTSGHRRTLVRFAPDFDIEDLYWTDRPSEGARLVFSIIGGPVGTQGGVYSYGLRTRLIRFEVGGSWANLTHLAPDHREQVHVAYQTPDSVAVLFIARENSGPRQPDRQLTSYAP